MADKAVDNASKVEVPCAAWREMWQEWRLIKDLLGGTKAMRLAREEYLPKFEGEDEKAYNARLKRAYLYNHYKKAVDALVGKPYSKPVTYPEDITPELEIIAKDFDMQGNDITIFTKNWFACALANGHSFCLVDYPNIAGDRYTRRDEKMKNIRPYAVHFKPYDVIGWKSISMNGVQKLLQVRIKQAINRPEGEFGEVEDYVIRVYDWDPVLNTVSWRVFEDKGELGWVETSFGTMVGMDEIPIVCLYTNQKGFFLSEPPLLDLAYLNVAHWQTTSDHRTIIHLQASPILFAKGWPKNELPSTVQIGANRMLVSSNPDASLSYVEHTGTAIGKIESYITKLEDQMAAMAIKLMAEKRPGGVTATEVTVDASAAESALKSMVSSLQDAVDYVIYFMLLWSGDKPKDDDIPQFKVNNDFGLMFGNDLIANWLLKAQSLGIITRKTVGEGAKSLGYLDEDLDMDEELGAADEETRIALENAAAALGGDEEDDPPAAPPAGNSGGGEEPPPAE